MTKRYTVLRAESSAGTRDPFLGPGLAGTTFEPPEIGVEVADLSANDVRDLARDRGVAAVAPVMPVSLIRPVDVPGAAAAESAWGINTIGADATAFDGTGVTVAVLDTGIDDEHDAFEGVTILQRDFSGSGDGDVDGHGTHCAGTIFGRDVGGKRIGVARGVKRALIGKVLADDGGGASDWLFQGIQWALNEGASVISMSLGFDFPGMVNRLVAQDWPVDLATSAGLEAYRGNLRMFDALMGLVAARRVLDGGCVVVAATGNESRRELNPQYEIAASLPAAAEGIVSVGALERKGTKLSIASFSNTLAQISAPGVGVLSAKVGGGLRSLSGTSMATPHVAGVAALWWQALRQSLAPANAGTVIAKLLASARADVFADGVDIADRGVGLVTCPQ